MTPLNLYCPINLTSYGYVSCYILRELSRLYDVACSVISEPQCENVFVEEVRTAVNKIPHPLAKCLKIWHQHDLFNHIGTGKYTAFPIFELDNFSELEIASLNCPDELIVCSQWAKDVLEETGKVRGHVSVAPLGVDTTIFKPNVKFVRDEKKPVTFLNCGKWELRKGHDILIEAFNAAFTQEDHVELWMMPHNFFLKPEQARQWETLYSGSKLKDKVKLFPRQQTQSDVYNIMKQADCGVFPARAEGWNLELLEMMAIGKDVIATNNTAHTEFCNEKNAKLVTLEKKTPAVDGVFFDGTKGNWYDWDETSFDVLVDHFRAVYDKIHNNGRFGNFEGIETGRRFSWSNTAQKIIQALET